jgi:hypothetical protein
LGEFEAYSRHCQELVAVATRHQENLQSIRDKMLSEVNGQHAVVAEKLRKVEDLRHHIASLAGAETVKLNVGGTLFEIGRAALQRHPLSYFGLLLEGEVREDRQSYFIDRSPEGFELILDYLRGEDLTVRLMQTEQVVLSKLLREATFYGLTELAKILKVQQEEEWIISPTANGTVLDNGLTLIKTGELGQKACISLGTVGWMEGEHEFQIMFGEAGGSHIGVGVARAGVHQTDLLQNVHKFYALDCGNGRAIGIGGVAKQVIEPDRIGSFSKISVKLDLHHHTVTFGVDGEWLPESFTNIAPGIYYPYFFIGDMEKKVSVVRSCKK